MFKIRRPIEETQRITVKFGEWYIYGKHRGIDFASKCPQYSSGIGCPIRAVARGEWKETGNNKSYGNYVILKHKDGFETLYGHLRNHNYKKGYTTVNAGDIIGFSGNTGTFTTGPHLHLELRLNDVPVDPMPYIEAGDKLREWARARTLMQVENKGAIKFMTKDGIVDLTEENCWKIMSKNTWGISENDYNDLLDLL